ncbi:MAG: protein phosphatase CheZ [Pseudomonadota bacterium]
MAAARVGEQRARTVQRLRELLAALEAGDDETFDAGLDALVRARETGLFAYVARLTRELHEAVVEMRMDERLARLAGDEIPDARDRLDYVMQVTESAAHRTLDLVDEAREVAAGIDRAAAQLAETEAVLAEAHPDVASVGVLMHEVHGELTRCAAALRGTLSELAQAQAYQDISGQIIKRVITLVRNVETALLELLRAAGSGLQSAPQRPIQPLSGELAGPALPGQAGAASQQDADELLASLGF